jgi:hypothetical protein
VIIMESVTGWRGILTGLRLISSALAGLPLTIASALASIAAGHQ